MKLTDSEQQEISYLREIRQGYIPLSQEQFARIKYLNDKEFHNQCPNPHCIGYEGTEQETICPKCKRKLLKTLNN